MKRVNLAVKAFILNNEGRILLIRRSNEEPYMPGVWEIPGGKTDPSKDPHLELKREVKEETGLEIEIIKPLNVQHFRREDLGAITMIIFECKNLGTDDVVLNKEEHSEFIWTNLEDSKEKLTPFFHGEVDMILKNL